MHSFSSFRQRWVSERSASHSNRFDRQAGVAQIRGGGESNPMLSRIKTETSGIDSALSRLKDFRQQKETRTTTQIGNRPGLSSRTNFSLTERLSQSSFGRDQPTFQHRRSAASQLREIKQIARDGSIITKTSQISTWRKENVSATRPRAGSNSSVLGENLASKIGQNAAIKSGDCTNLQKQNESIRGEVTDPAQSIASRLRSRRYSRDAGGEASSKRQTGENFTTTKDRLSQAKLRLGLKAEKAGGDALGGEKSSEASVLLEKIKRDIVEPVEGAHETQLPIGAEGTKEGNDSSNVEDSVKNEIDESGETQQERKMSAGYVESRTATRIEQMTSSEEVHEAAHEDEAFSFERSRSIASRIFEKLDSKKAIEMKSKFAVEQRRERATCVSEKIEKNSGEAGKRIQQKQVIVEREVLQQEALSKNAFDFEIEKTKPLRIPKITDVSNQEMEKEAKCSVAKNGSLLKESGGVASKGEVSTAKAAKRTPPPVARKPTPAASVKSSPEVSPKSSQAVTLSPSFPPSIFLGSGETIRVAVVSPKDHNGSSDEDLEEKYAIYLILTSSHQFTSVQLHL